MTTPIAPHNPSSPSASRAGTPAGGSGQRQAITEHFLSALQDVVSRYRAPARPGEQGDFAPEALTAEVAHHLAVARTLLRRHPSMADHPSLPPGPRTIPRTRPDSPTTASTPRS